MMEAMSRINWLAVLAATVGTTLLGGLWFTFLFGRAYAAALGRAYDPRARPAPIFIVGPLACTIVTTVTSAILTKALGFTSIGDGITFGALVGFGYCVATMINTAINPNMPHPLRYGLLSGPFFFLTSVITCLILVTMP